MQRHITSGKGVGPAQRAHRDVLRRPVADARQRFQQRDGGRHIDAAMQLQLPAVYGTRQRDDGGLPLPHDTDASERIAAALYQRGCSRKQTVQLRPGRFKRCAETQGQPLGQRAGSCHRDLLPKHGAHRQLEAAKGARHAQAIALREARMQRGVDGLRVGVEVEQRAHTANHQRQHLAQRIADFQPQLRARLVEAKAQPASVQRAARFNAEGAHDAGAVPGARHRFNPVDGALAKKSQHRRHVVGRAIAEPHGDAGRAALRLASAFAAQLSRVEPVVLCERRVEAPHAGKAAGQRDFGDRQLRVGQQLFGRQQPPRLQILQRRDAELHLENAPQVAGADAHLRSNAVYRRSRSVPRGIGNGRLKPSSRRGTGFAGPQAGGPLGAGACGSKPA